MSKEVKYIKFYKYWIYLIFLTLFLAKFNYLKLTKCKRPFSFDILLFYNWRMRRLINFWRFLITYNLLLPKYNYFKFRLSKPFIYYIWFYDKFKIYSFLFFYNPEMFWILLPTNFNTRRCLWPYKEGIFVIKL